MPRINIRDDDDDEVEGDMTPMIDIIFLLLVFFILTTKFIPEEKVISNLLPTDKGTANASAPIDEKETVHLKVYPAQFTQGLQPSNYDEQWKANRNTDQCKYQIGNTEFLVVDGGTMLTRGGDELNGALQQIHAYIHQGLQRFEQGGPRKDLPPIVIHGFTGLPWMYVLAAYDAVREWENQHGAAGDSMEALLNARDVTFAPPRLRGYRKWEMGYELFEIIHMK